MRMADASVVIRCSSKSKTTATFVILPVTRTGTVCFLFAGTTINGTRWQKTEKLLGVCVFEMGDFLKIFLALINGRITDEFIIFGVCGHLQF